MKTYPVSAHAGIDNPAALDAVIVPPSISTASLASVVQQIMDNSEGLVCVVVDMGARVVRAKAAVAATATAIVATIAASTGHAAAAVFTKDDNTVRSSTFTITDGDPFVTNTCGVALGDILQPQPLSLSSSQVVGMIEDGFISASSASEFTLTAFPAIPVVVVLDQGTGKITVVQFDTQPHAAASYAGMAATIGYDQTPTVTGTTRQPLE